LSEYWSENSLKGRYLKEKKDFYADIPDTKKEGRFNKIMNDVKFHRLTAQIKNFICPNCLESIIFKELIFKCPFCHEIYGKKSNDIGEISTNKFFNELLKSGQQDKEEVIKGQSLFDQCSKCGGKIRYVECYRCHKSIDLFAPYNEEELEAKRYE